MLMHSSYLLCVWRAGFLTHHYTETPGSMSVCMLSEKGAHRLDKQCLHMVVWQPSVLKTIEFSDCRIGRESILLYGRKEQSSNCTICCKPWYVKSYMHVVILWK